MTDEIITCKCCGKQGRKAIGRAIIEECDNRVKREKGRERYNLQKVAGKAHQIHEQNKSDSWMKSTPKGSWGGWCFPLSTKALSKPILETV